MHPNPSPSHHTLVSFRAENQENQGIQAPEFSCTGLPAATEIRGLNPAPAIVLEVTCRTIFGKHYRKSIMNASP